jgi:hypothetical protein
MSDQQAKALEALRAHLDLDEAPDALLTAWQAATGEEKKDLLDRLLMETLLVDTLGRRRAPGDVSRGREERRTRPRASLLAGLLAAAAVLIVAVGAALLLWPRSPGYPEPKAAGDFSIESLGGGRLPREAPLRGARLAAGPGDARLSLGGYCELKLDPGTVVVVGGREGKEVIELEEGRLVCRVESARGEFAVLTPRGFLEVVGTEFEIAVRYPEPKGERDMAQWRRSAIVTVAVVTGLVAYQFGDLTGELGSGTSKVFAGEAAGGGKRIVAGKPTYKSKGDNEAWKEKGRIVGLVRQCPGCTVEALDAAAEKVVLSCTVAAKGTTYELQWLSAGTYTLRVKAEGYEALVVKDLVVKAKNDLLMNIEFEE